MGNIIFCGTYAVCINGVRSREWYGCNKKDESTIINKCVKTLKMLTLLTDIVG